jgi:hypothetical protein
MVINRNKLADLISSWPIQCYKLMRWIAFQLFRVEKTTHQGAAAINQNVSTTLGEVLRTKTAQITHNAKDKGPPTHAGMII